MITRRSARAALAASILVASSVFCAFSRAGMTADQKVSAQSRQTELLDRLRSLKTDLARSESQRTEARDALRESDAAISDANRKLRELAGQQAQTRRQLDALLAQKTRTESEMAAERARLADLVRAQYLNSRQNPWQLLLSGANPNVVGRNLVYLGYVSRKRQSVVGTLEQKTGELDGLADSARQRAAELEGIAKAQQTQRSALEHEKQQRSATLTRIAEQVRTQRKQVGALERDAARLNGLIVRLTRLIAEHEQRTRRPNPERPKKIAPPARDNPPTGPQSTNQSPVPAPSPEAEPDIAWNNSGPGFASIRGHLRLPVHGEIAGRFGQARAQSSMTWKGVFIHALQGADVHAIAAGRVVFADWLRGFGNLLIVDHGDQYLSIYGGNEALYKQAGETVKPGETIASVGSSGGGDQTGLYFELRHQGEPFDPLRWVH